MKPLQLELHDGQLHDAQTGEDKFSDAPYFTDLDEARRWLDENLIDAKVEEA
jgi:hypothetical protein